MRSRIWVCSDRNAFRCPTSIVNTTSKSPRSTLSMGLETCWLRSIPQCVPPRWCSAWQAIQVWPKRRLTRTRQALSPSRRQLVQADDKGAQPAGSGDHWRCIQTGLWASGFVPIGTFSFFCSSRAAVAILDYHANPLHILSLYPFLIGFPAPRLPASLWPDGNWVGNDFEFPGAT